MLRKIKDIIFKIIYLCIATYLLIFIPTIWGYKPLVVISGSMQPILKVGGILYYEEIDINDFDVGDIVAYELNDHTISHRIIKIEEDGFVTKGDYNKSVDTYKVKFNQVLGKGTNWSIPYIGYYADFMYSHRSFSCILMIIIGIDLCNDWYVLRKKKVRGFYEEKN